MKMFKFILISILAVHVLAEKSELKDEQLYFVAGVTGEKVVGSQPIGYNEPMSGEYNLFNYDPSFGNVPVVPASPGQKIVWAGEQTYPSMFYSHGKVNHNKKTVHVQQEQVQQEQVQQEQVQQERVQEEQVQEEQVQEEEHKGGVKKVSTTPRPTAVPTRRYVQKKQQSVKQPSSHVRNNVVHREHTVNFEEIFPKVVAGKRRLSEEDSLKYDRGQAGYYYYRNDLPSNYYNGGYVNYVVDNGYTSSYLPSYVYADRGQAGYVADRGQAGFVGDRGQAGYVADRGQAGFVADRGQAGYVADRGQAGYVADRGQAGYVADRGQAGLAGLVADRYSPNYQYLVRPKSYYGVNFGYLNPVHYGYSRVVPTLHYNKKVVDEKRTVVVAERKPEVYKEDEVVVEPVVKPVVDTVVVASAPEKKNVHVSTHAASPVKNDDDDHDGDDPTIDHTGHKHDHSGHNHLVKPANDKVYNNVVVEEKKMVVPVPQAYYNPYYYNVYGSAYNGQVAYSPLSYNVVKRVQSVPSSQYVYNQSPYHVSSYPSSLYNYNYGYNYASPVVDNSQLNYKLTYNKAAQVKHESPVHVRFESPKVSYNY